MNLEAVQTGAEVVGAIGVILSLIYLGVQVRENTRQLRFTASQHVAESLDRAFDPIYAEPSNTVWQTGHADLEGLSEADRLLFDALMARQVHNIANMLDAKDSGLLGERRTDSLYQKFYGALFATPGGEQWVKENPHFRDLISQVLKE